MKEQVIEALGLLRRAAEKRPDDLSIKEKLLGAYLRAGLFDEAVEEFFSLVHRKPDWPQVHFETLGRQAGRTSTELHAAFERAAADQPNNALAWYGLGFMQQLMGDQRAADAAFRRGISANPSFAPLHYNLGVALMDYPDQAARHLHQATTLSSAMAEPHYALATIYMTQDRVKAVYHYERFIRLAPPYLQGYIEQAQASLQLLGRS